MWGGELKKEKKLAPTQEPGTVIQSSNNSKKIEINPEKVGGPESLYSLGRGRLAPPPLKKALENRYRVEEHVHSPIFQGLLIEKKLDLYLKWLGSKGGF